MYIYMYIYIYIYMYLYMYIFIPPTDVLWVQVPEDALSQLKQLHTSLGASKGGSQLSSTLEFKV